MDGGQTKFAAAWLIERSGLRKGAGEGVVGLSSNHTLAIVNRGGASAEDLVGFARMVRETVLRAFGVTLIPEPRLLGFSEAPL